MKSITEIISVLLFLNIGLTLSQKAAPTPTPKPVPPRFNGSDVLMELSRPMRIHFYEVINGPKIGKLIEKIDIETAAVPIVTSSSKPGENSTTISNINVTYSNIQSHGLINNLSVVNDASFTLDFSLNKVKWSLLSISTSLSGQIVNGSSTKPISGGIKLRPYIKTGYSPNPADTAYGRGYTTGSPSKKLSWYCNKQEFTEDPSSKKVGDIVIGLEFPGLLVQPFDKGTLNGTTPKFGYSWDCDPLVSAKIWEIVFIVLILTVIFLWSVQMMLNLNTPTRYDDPKGKPLTVPLHE